MRAIAAILIVLLALLGIAVFFLLSPDAEEAPLREAAEANVPAARLGDGPDDPVRVGAIAMPERVHYVAPQYTEPARRAHPSESPTPNSHTGPTIGGQVSYDCLMSLESKAALVAEHC